jgi:putative oxidoreductase
MSAAVAWLGRFPLGLCQLLFRLAIAGVFLRAGLTKIMSWPMTVQLFSDEYKVPIFSAPAAAMLATAFELGCSALLVAGFATRIATVPLLAMIAVIQLFVYPGAWPEHLTWASILVFLLTRGPGPLSLDGVIGVERSRTSRS